MATLLAIIVKNWKLLEMSIKKKTQILNNILMLAYSYKMEYKKEMNQLSGHMHQHG